MGEGSGRASTLPESEEPEEEEEEEDTSPLYEVEACISMCSEFWHRLARNLSERGAFSRSQQDVASRPCRAGFIEPISFEPHVVAAYSSSSCTWRGGMHMAWRIVEKCSRTGAVQQAATVFRGGASRYPAMYVPNPGPLVPEDADKWTQQERDELLCAPEEYEALLEELRRVRQTAGYDTMDMLMHNLQAAGSLVNLTAHANVFPVQLDDKASRALYVFLEERWDRGRGVLLLPAAAAHVHGFSGYPRVVGMVPAEANCPDFEKQMRNSLVVGRDMLLAWRAEVPHFKELERDALTAAQRVFPGKNLTTTLLVHVVVQSRLLQSATSFSQHLVCMPRPGCVRLACALVPPFDREDTTTHPRQDTEESDKTKVTVVVKLSEESEGAAASMMRVVGARGPFAYGPRSGSTAVFDSNMYHVSMEVPDASEHAKVVFFLG